MSTAPPPLPRNIELEPEQSEGFRITSGTWVVAGLILLGVFAAISGLLYRHIQNRKPVDFWGFDSHRIIKDCPSIQATLIKPDPLVITPQTPGNEIWHDDLFMMVESRYLVEARADVSDRPEFQVKITNGPELKQALQQHRTSKFPDNLEITNDAQFKALLHQVLEEHPEKATALGEIEVHVEHADVHPDQSLRGPLRENASYDWQAFPWSEEPQWRYALTFAKEEITNFGTKHELRRTFTFTLVFDVTCRWVALQSVDKLTALQPSVQQRLKRFFVTVFPDSDKPIEPVTPTPTPTATGSPTASPSATPSGTPSASPSATPTAAAPAVMPLAAATPTAAGVTSTTGAPGAAAIPPTAAIPTATAGPLPPAPQPALVSPPGTGMKLFTDPMIREESTTTPIGIPNMAAPAGTGGTAPPPLQFNTANPLLRPGSATTPPTALPSGTVVIPTIPTNPTTTSTLKP
jgi:hypothetical protein